MHYVISGKDSYITVNIITITILEIGLSFKNDSPQLC